MIRRLKSSVLFKTSQRRTKPFRRFLRKFQNDWSTDFSAMLAYNLLIALLPIAVGLFGISGLILRNYPDLENSVKDKIIHLFPIDNTTQAGIEQVNTNRLNASIFWSRIIFREKVQVVDLAFSQLSNDAGFLLSLGIVFALFGASRLVIAIDKCLTIIYRLPEREFLHQNLLAIGMIFLLILMIPLMIVCSSAPSALMSVIPGGGGRLGTFLAGMIFSSSIGFLLFETIYWFIPNKKMTFRVTWCGSLVAALTLQLFMICFPLYVGRFMGNYAGQRNQTIIRPSRWHKNFSCCLGQIGFAVILLLFFYYFATILILGAQINSFFFEDYRPFSVGLGSYVNKVYTEYGPGPRDRYLNENDLEQEQSLAFNTNDESNEETIDRWGSSNDESTRTLSFLISVKNKSMKTMNWLWLSHRSLVCLTSQWKRMKRSSVVSVRCVCWQQTEWRISSDLTHRFTLFRRENSVNQSQWKTKIFLFSRDRPTAMNRQPIDHEIDAQLDAERDRRSESDDNQHSDNELEQNSVYLSCPVDELPVDEADLRRSNEFTDLNSFRQSGRARSSKFDRLDLSTSSFVSFS